MGPIHTERARQSFIVYRQTYNNSLILIVSEKTPMASWKKLLAPKTDNKSNCTK